MSKKRIICRHCQYYYVTWDRKFPYGCKAFDFKSKQTPSLDVFQSSGQDCMKLKPKIVTQGDNHD